MANKYCNLADAKRFMQKAMVHVGTTAPTSPIVGMLWFYIEGGKFASVKVYGGSSWSSYAVRR